MINTTEEVLRAQEDLDDAMRSLENAEEEVLKAIEWKNKCSERVQEYQDILIELNK